MKYNKISFQQELERRFPDNMIKILEFSGTNKPIKYQCLKCNRIIEKNRANHLYENKSLCQHCYSVKESKIRNWIMNFFKTTNQFQLINWSNNTADDLIIYCNHCKRTFNKQPGNIYNKKANTICPYCGDNGAPILQEDFQQLMEKNNLIDYKILSYTAITKRVKFQHSCGFVFTQVGSNFLKSKGCPKCFKTHSKGEIKIENWLVKNNIKYIYEYPIKDINNYSYDFYLPEYNIFIEYQGQQHYFPVDYFGGEKKFQQQLLHDKNKVEYAQKNNYQLIIIPYTDYNNIESYLLPILGSTTNLTDVVSSETKEKTSTLEDNIV